MTKRTANKQIKPLRAELAEIRTAWERRGVADGEFARSREIERQITEIEIAVGTVRRPVVDTLWS